MEQTFCKVGDVIMSFFAAQGVNQVAELMYWLSFILDKDDDAHLVPSALF